MKYNFPIVIIADDYHSENVSGLGIRDLAAAIETQRMAVRAVTTFAEMASLAKQASRASAFIVSLNDSDFTDVESDKSALTQLREFVRQVRRVNPDIP